MLRVSKGRLGAAGPKAGPCRVPKSKESATARCTDGVDRAALFIYLIRNSPSGRALFATIIEAQASPFYPEGDANALISGRRLYTSDVGIVARSTPIVGAHPVIVSRMRP